MIILHKEMTIFPEDGFAVSKRSAKPANIFCTLILVSWCRRKEVTPFRKGVTSGNYSSSMDMSES